MLYSAVCSWIYIHSYIFCPFPSPRTPAWGESMQGEHTTTEYIPSPNFFTFKTIPFAFDNC